MLIKRPTLEKKGVSSPCLHTDANTCQKTLSQDEHTTLMANRGGLNRLATQSIMQLLALLSLIDTSKTATSQSFIELTRLVGQAHIEASDKLHSLVFVFVRRCSVGQKERLRFTMPFFSVKGQKDHYWTRAQPRVVRLSGNLADVQELHARLVPRRRKLPRTHRMREFVRLLWLEIVQGAADETI